jgi:hypothetical protein
MPCDPATCDWLYKLGQVDAMAWARANGIRGAWDKRQQQAGKAASAGRRRLSSLWRFFA